MAKLKEKIEFLQNEGWEVEIQHKRETDYFSWDSGNPGTMVTQKIVRPKGGSTIVNLKKGGITVKAIAECSYEDNYNKRIGALIALGRAMKKLNLI